jgi:hypothetical protein
MNKQERNAVHENLDAKIETLLRRRRLEPASANLAQRIIQKAFEMPRKKMVGNLYDPRHLKQKGRNLDGRKRE